MQQTEQVLAGERDYAGIYGQTGPLVYPAGHVWLYALLGYISAGGTRRLLLQGIFAGMQLAAVALLGLTVAAVDAGALPWCALWLITVRARNAFVNGLFNDGVQVLFVYAALYLLLVARRPAGALLAYSAAVSVKMSALLYAPAFLLVYWRRFGVARSIAYGLPAAALQLALAAPFLATHPWSYLARSFELDRSFFHFLSHNWKFLPENIFQDRRFHFALVAAHLTRLVLYYYRRGWLAARRPAGDGAVWVPADQLDAFVVTNFIGVVCARSLHYSFYTWYFHTLPWLFYRSRLPVALATALAVAIELTWNQWQPYKAHDWPRSGPVSAVTILFAIVHAALLVLVLVRARHTVVARAT